MIPIEFKGRDDLFLFGTFTHGGAIATMGQYEGFELSYAHLTRDGRIMRYREQIGHRDDLVVREETA